MKIIKVLSLTLALGLFVCSSAPADIVVSWDPAVEVIPGVGLQGSLSIYADIPEDDAIVAWGLDLYYDEAIASVNSIVYGPLWSEVSHDPTAQDVLDGVDFDMAAMGFFPPAGVSGNVLLATLTFDALAVGETWLSLQAHALDLSEGFAKNPPPTGAFVPFTDLPGKIVVLPEPATLALLGFAGLALIRRR